ncbi:uncharacterized protein LOC115981862 isoform X4 [Quercus lobata]|uniref:uncharacterized protein LOC115981862 isoform X4 n=1 Tax=Quercus lobata TaxID=97700 RepID=UPI00124744B2|nr:uncharacterized protein LOC115981862 isoform X4 [Quercus lobata]
MPPLLNCECSFEKKELREMEMDMYRCVECGFRIKTLFVQYSPGNIRLMKCLLTDVFLGNLLFLGTFLLATKIFLSKSAGSLRIKDILLAILISSYLKMFLIVMMVWEFPSSVIFITDLFVLSSNTVAVKVMTESAMSRCIGACFSAHAVKIFTTQEGLAKIKEVLDTVMNIYMKTMTEDDDKEVVAQACMSIADIIKEYGYVAIEQYVPRLVDATLVLLREESCCQQEESDGDIDDDDTKHDEELMDAVSDLLPAFARELHALCKIVLWWLLASLK